MVEKGLRDEEQVFFINLILFDFLKKKRRSLDNALNKQQTKKPD